MRDRRPDPPRPAGGDAPGAWSLAWPALLVAAVAALAFARGLQNGFTGWDDSVYTFANPNNQDLAGLARVWTSIENEQYYPLTFTSHWLETRLFGDRAAGHHAASLLLHAANAAAVLALLRALRLARTPAVLAAALWAVHPTSVMSVSWIAERKNLLSCLFAVLATIAWIRWRERGGAWRWALALAAFVLALLAKTQVLALPLAWLALERWLPRRPPALDGSPPARSFARAAAAILPMLACSVAASFVTRIFEQRYLDPYTLASTPPLPERVQIAASALFVYLRKAAWPWPLSPFYPLWDVSASSLAWWLPVLLLAAAAAALALRARRLDARVPWALAHFALALGPSLGLVPLANLPITYYSDHYLYVALIGPAALAGLALEAASGRAAAPARAVAVALAAAFALGTQRYVPAFRDAESLWRRTLAVSPESYVGHLGLAEALSARGALDEARAHYRRATEIEPGWIDAWQRLGAAEARAGDLGRAEPALREALARSPGNVDALCDLGTVLERTGRTGEALHAFEAAAASGPNHARARLELGRIYLAFGRHADAERQFAALVARHAGVARGWLGLATALRGLGREREAARALEEGLSRNPGDLDLQNLLALLLASARDDAVRDGERAVALARSTCEATGYGDHQLVATLAAACAEAGRREEAVAWSAKARELALAVGDAASAAEEERRGELYRQGRALRR